jgi:leucine dehydrogenase
MSLFDVLSRDGSMELHSVHDEPSGLRAMVAIHDTRLGPAVGGVRIFPYASEDEATVDVVRLARGMTAKAALAGLPHGGGKAVIWTDPARPAADRKALFRAFGRFVDILGGRYLTSSDSGVTTDDLDVIREVTEYCLGASAAAGGSGSPARLTAVGVRRGIEACAHVVLGRKDLAGLHVAIQGVGAVGNRLALELHAAGARLTVADVDPARARRTAEATGAAVVAPAEIVAVPCDVFSPCALGGAISDATVDRLRCRVVAGAANNQLSSPPMGRLLVQREIFYAPDYAINAGGLISVAQEWKGYDAEAALAKTLAIYDTISDIARRALRTGTPTHEIADRMVEEILGRAGVQPPADVSTSSILARPSSSRSRGTAV